MWYRDGKYYCSYPDHNPYPSRSPTPSDSSWTTYSDYESWNESVAGSGLTKENLKNDHQDSDASLKDLMEESCSLPPQIAESFWCIEYVAKFIKDLRCILDAMEMSYGCSGIDDYGERINEMVALRILEFLFDPSKNVCVAEPRVEFDLSLSNSDVLHTVLDGNCDRAFPSCQSSILLRLLLTRTCICHYGMSLMKNESNVASSMEANKPVSRDDSLAHMDLSLKAKVPAAASMEAKGPVFRDDPDTYKRRKV